MGNSQESLSKKRLSALSGAIAGVILGLSLTLPSLVYAQSLISKPRPASSPKAASGAAGAQSSGGSTGATVNVSGKPMHVSASRSLRDLKTNRLELFGNVYIRRPQELLTADYAVLDLKTERLVAEGNVVYFTPNSVIYGKKMDFNYVLGTGVIEDGRVESDRYQLAGESLERLGEDEYYGKEADYTTCRDCPASWKIHGKSIRVTVEGYARVSHMLIKINDAPMVYFPFLIIPVKTERQTGLLFPKFRLGTIHGFQYIQPFFWAISRSQDMTLGFGKLTARGYKGEMEHRYALGTRSTGTSQFYLLQDRTFIDPYQRRWAINAVHNLELPGKVDLKFHWLDASDRDYPRIFPEDIPGYGEPALVSELGISKSTRDASAWLDVKRIKRTLRPQLVGFDHQQVQEVPNFNVSSIDHRIFKNFPLFWGANFNYSRFWRDGPGFDLLRAPGDLTAPTVYTPGRDPLRKAHRFNLTPELYLTTTLFDVIEFVPSFQYRTYYYVFDQLGVPPLRREYAVGRAELATSFERIYGGTVKHRIRPALVYSAIPFLNEDKNHPFIKQLNYGTTGLLGGQNGRQFDDFDIVPVTIEENQYFTPIGNSLTYEFGNHFILKTYDNDPYVISDEARRERKMPIPRMRETPSYQKVADFRLGQTINCVELRKNAGDERPLSRAYAIASLSTKQIGGNTEVYYYPYSRAFQLNTGWSYFLARFQKRLLVYERSFNVTYSRNRVNVEVDTISFGFNWSINDYIAVAASRAMDLLTARTLSTAGRITFQSPSQCYQVVLNMQKTIDRQFEFSPTFQINLAGQGYTSVTDPNTAGAVSGGAR